MIERFRHKGPSCGSKRATLRGVNPQHVEKIENTLGLLDVAQDIEDMNVPTFRLHALRGDLKGFWAVTARANWRIIFRFADGPRATST